LQKQFLIFSIGFSFKNLIISIPTAPTATPTSQGFFFGTPATPTTSKDTDSKETTAGSVSGFFPFPSAQGNIGSEKKTGWKCACCEQLNKETDLSCSTCLVSRPKPKDRTTTLATTQSTGWKCACCEQMNNETDRSCSMCLVSRPKPKN